MLKPRPCTTSSLASSSRPHAWDPAPKASWHKQGHFPHYNCMQWHSFVSVAEPLQILRPIRWSETESGPLQCIQPAHAVFFDLIPIFLRAEALDWAPPIQLPRKSNNSIWIVSMRQNHLNCRQASNQVVCWFLHSRTLAHSLIHFPISTPQLPTGKSFSYFLIPSLGQINDRS